MWFVELASQTQALKDLGMIHEIVPQETKHENWHLNLEQTTLHLENLDQGCC